MRGCQLPAGYTSNVYSLLLRDTLDVNPLILLISCPTGRIFFACRSKNDSSALRRGVIGRRRRQQNITVKKLIQAGFGLLTQRG